MNASKLKGNLLEYIVRKVLTNCGFINVTADGLLIYNSRGLKFINGKGSSHDADVLMAPPIQMPFSYPYRLLFECKAYSSQIGLSIVRNVLGLRYDINEFEIVTRDQLIQRQNNRRSNLAIDNRPRYIYQVGLASANGFSKPAIEFATNNKIPLFSLDWILPANITTLFNTITNAEVAEIGENLGNLSQFLKGAENIEGQQFLEHSDNTISQIYNSFREFENNILIGLLETGDLVFITTNNSENIRFIRENSSSYIARLHYNIEERERWTLRIQETPNNIEFYFHLPRRIIELWRDRNYDYRAGLGIKANIFRKIYVFIEDTNLPFRILNLDIQWIDRLLNQ